MSSQDLNGKTFEVCNINGDLPRMYPRIKKQVIEDNATILQIQDISKHLLQEQFKQENDTLTMLNACVSHELRNPLNSTIVQSVE